MHPATTVGRGFKTGTRSLLCPSVNKNHLTQPISGIKPDSLQYNKFCRPVSVSSCSVPAQPARCVSTTATSSDSSAISSPVLLDELRRSFAARSVARTAQQGGKPRVCVLGAGVNGLATAVRCALLHSAMCTATAPSAGRPSS